MKRIVSASVLIVLSLLVISACATPQTIDIDTMTIDELTALKSGIETKLSQLQSETVDGAIEVISSNYNSYAKSPDSHTGETITFTGEIAQVIEGTYENDYRISVGVGSNDIFYVSDNFPDSSIHFVTGDIVIVIGTFDGLMSYQSTLGGQITVPQCIASEIFEFADLITIYTRDNPAKIGQEAIFPGESYGNTARTAFKIKEVIRGTAANKIAKEYSRLNTPDDGYEYMLAMIRVEALSAPDGKASISDYYFKFVSADGKEYDSTYLYGYNDCLSDIYEGSSQEAYLVCEVKKDDNPLIVYNQTSDYPIWFDPNNVASASEISATSRTASDGSIAYTNCKANLRKETSTKSDRVTELPKGTEVLIVGTETVGEQTWYQIEVDSMNISGYIWDSLVDIAD